MTSKVDAIMKEIKNRWTDSADLFCKAIPVDSVQAILEKYLKQDKSVGELIEFYKGVKEQFSDESMIWINHLDRWIEDLQSLAPTSPAEGDEPIERPYYKDDNWEIVTHYDTKSSEKEQERVVEIKRNIKWWYHDCPCGAWISVFWTNYCFDCWAKIKRIK